MQRGEGYPVDWGDPDEEQGRELGGRGYAGDEGEVSSNYRNTVRAVSHTRCSS